MPLGVSVDSDSGDDFLKNRTIDQLFLAENRPLSSALKVVQKLLRLVFFRSDRVVLDELLVRVLRERVAIQWYAGLVQDLLQRRRHGVALDHRRQQLRQ